MMGFIFAGWGRNGIDLIAARVQFFSDAFDGAALAGSVPAFKDDHQAAAALIEQVFVSQQLLLQGFKLLLIIGTIERLGQIYAFKHAAPPRVEVRRVRGAFQGPVYYAAARRLRGGD